MKIPIVSFYCDLNDSTFYSDHATQMMSQCDAIHRPYYILQKNYGSSWIDNVRAKPTFLLEMYEMLDTPFLWIDVDCSVLNIPSCIDSMSCDLASAKHNNGAIHDCVHYIGKSNKSYELLTIWKAQCDVSIKRGSHTILIDILKKRMVKNLNFEFLPDGFIHGPHVKIGLSKEKSKINFMKYERYR